MNIDERLKRIEKALGIEDPKLTTRIAVVQDRSASMGPLADATIGGFNEYVETLKQDDSDEAYLTLIQFNDAYNVVYDAKPVAKVPKLTQVGYRPSGMTALYDAVGRAIDELSAHDGGNSRKLVVIMTDGQENSSREYDFKQVKGMIEKYQESGDWTFVFLGAGVDEFQGQKLGILRGNTMGYGHDSHSHSVAYDGLSTATSGLRSGSSMSSQAFIEDMGGGTATAITGSGTPDVNLWVPGQDDDDDDKEEGAPVG